MNMTDEYALQIPQSGPDILLVILGLAGTDSKLAYELSPGTFSSIKENIPPIRNLDQS